MIKEFSAGGIVYKKIQIPKSKFQKNKVVWLVCQHSQHKGWVFPKGLIGDHQTDETKEETALREVGEETGVKTKIVMPLKFPVSYFYTWQQEKRFKTVHYFLMEYENGDTKDHDWEMSAVEWWDEEKVKKDLTYKSDKKAFKEALKMMKLSA